MRAEAPSLDVVQKRTGVGRGTVQRIRDGDSATSLSILTKIAEAFGLEVWQLMVPGLDPDKLPELAASAPSVQPDLQRLVEEAIERRLGPASEKRHPHAA